MVHETSHSSVKTYLFVFAGLAVLTGATVFLSYAGLPHKIALVLAGLIALTKCSLIVAFFMHMRSESKAIYAVFFVALFFVGVIIFSLIPDIGIQ